MAQSSRLNADCSPGTLATAIEQNGVECCLSWAAWPEMQLGRNDRMIWTISDVAFPFFNNVFNARLDDENVESPIQETVDRFRQRGVPALWWTGPSTRPADLGHHLQRAGFEHAFEAPAMAVDLDAMNETVSLPSGFAIKEVIDDIELRVWCRVMTPVYGFPDFAGEAWFRMLASLGLGAERPLRHFLGRLDGKAVATASVYFGAGVAGISSVATLPHHRHRGYGTAVTVAALMAAKQQGYHVGTLFSSVMGERMYRRIGFHEYGRGGCYAWTPKS